MKILKIVLIILAILASVAIFFRFYYTKSFSPSATAEFDKNGLSISIEYCQPSKKGRLIFGDESEKALIPYGKWWRTGANEATVIKFSKDVLIAGKPLKAGTYTLFTIPEKGDWTVIINSEVGQWGLSYNDKKDVLRVPVPSIQQSDSVEKFFIDFNEKVGGVDIILRWDTTKVIIPVK
jgi:Protein of unknown function (DUF2911)